MKKIIQFATVVALAILLGSCASLPSVQTRQMASSGALLQKALEESFYQTSSVLYERTYLKNTDGNKRLNDYIDTVNNGLVEEFDRRLKYLETLNAYFTALDALASRSDAKASQEAAIGLNASVMGLSEFVPESSHNAFKSMSAGISTASDFGLRLASQGTQRKYLRLAMDKAAPALDSICAVLGRDLEECDHLLLSNQQSVLSG